MVVIVFIVLLFIAILVILLCVMTVQLEIKIIVRGSRNRSFLVIRALGGLIHLRYNLSVQPKSGRLFSISLRKTDSPEKAYISAEGFFEFVKRSYKSFQRNAHYLKYLKDKIRVRGFSLMAQIGTGDAAHTALLTASLFTLSYLILCHLKNTYHIENQNINVIPLFDKESFELEADCIITFKLGHIIIVGIQKIAEKIKGGEGIARASN